MKRSLVGTRAGKPALNWPVVLITSLIVGLVSGVAAATVWFLITGKFDFATVLFAVALFLGLVVGESLRQVRSTPLDQLSPLD